MIGLLWAAVGWLAFREIRRGPVVSSQPGLDLLGKNPDATGDGGLSIGHIGHTITIEEIMSVLPMRTVMPYFVNRYPRPTQPASVAPMPLTVGETTVSPSARVPVFLDLTNYRILARSVVTKYNGEWSINSQWAWVWTYSGQNVYGWFADLHPDDWHLAETLKMAYSS